MTARLRYTSNQMKKKVLWAVFSLALSILTIHALFYNSGLSLTEFLLHISEASARWLVLAGLCMLLFLFFEGRSLVLILRALGYPSKKRKGFVYAAADFYFSSITPSASGGQPASAFFMRKDGISGTATTVTLLLNLTMYTLAIITLGFVSIIFFPDIFFSYELPCKILILFGTASMTALTVIFILLLKKQSVIIKIGNLIILAIKKIGFKSAAQKASERLQSTIENYNQCVATAAGKKGLFAKTFLLNLAQRAAQILVTVFCHLAMGSSIRDIARVFAIQTYVVVGSNFIPVPGAVGVSEFLMYYGHAALLGQDEAYTLALLSRGISFYTCSFISIVTVILGYIALKVKKQEGANL